jgi:hypothetical protein
MCRIIEVENEVPFGQAIYVSLYLSNTHLKQLVKHDRTEEHYLAWETVRKETNPFFQYGTGFEGYLVGRYSTPEEALDAIIAIHQHTLDAIARLYRFEYRFRSQLMKTLRRESCDSESIHTWSAYFGAELGRLRAQISENQTARLFQMHTYQLVKRLPPMDYHEIQGDVTQTYALAGLATVPVGRLAISPHMLKPSQQDAWLVAENIGEFGHPLVRKLLDAAQPIEPQRTSFLMGIGPV